MNKIFRTALSTAAAVMLMTSCSDALNTGSYVDIEDSEVVNSVPQLQKVLVSTYKQLLFNSDGEDRVFAGIPGFAMYPDLSGADITVTQNMGGNQCTSYEYSNSRTQAQDQPEKIWFMCYNVINRCNIILTHIDDANGDAAQKKHIKGQAKAIRSLMYFILIQNFQQTYIIAKEKRGVILRLSENDPHSMPFSTVSQVYDRIIDDLTDAKTDLVDYSRNNPYEINLDVVNGILARVYLVMNNWQGAYDAAGEAFANHSTLMTREQWRDGFDKMIDMGAPEIMWAMEMTDNNNLGGSTQFNFWYNQDTSYGEGYNDGPIYSFLNFFASQQYVDLFENTDDRYMFWKRTGNVDPEINTKGAYDKFKHYGDANGAVGGNTRPQISMMRGSEMLLIKAEAAAHLDGKTGEALQLLNTLQSARNASLSDGTNLLEDIYIERRKELLGEGVTGMYDLVRLQKPLIRYMACEANNFAGHYRWGVQYLDGYNASDAEPRGYLDSNDYHFFCQIPESELLTNAAVSNSDQNPFKGQ